MIVALSLFKVLLPLLYLVSWGAYFWLFQTDHPTARRLCTRFALTTVFLHLTAITIRSFALGRLPMASTLEFLSALALATLATYLVIEWRLKAKNTGVLVVGLAFIFEFFGDSLTMAVPDPSPLLSDPGFAGHVILVLVSYTALSLSFIYAVLYLLLSRQLMNRQFGLLFRRLPALETLERMSIGAVKIAVPALLGSLCLGHLWMYRLAENLPADLAAELSPWDAKIMVSWVIFLAYLLGLIGNRFLGWRGRRMNVMAVVAFSVTLTAMGAVQHFFPSFHKFKNQYTTAFHAESPDTELPPTLVTEVRK